MTTRQPSPAGRSNAAEDDIAQRLRVVEAELNAWDGWAYRLTEANGQAARVALDARLAELERLGRTWHDWHSAAVRNGEERDHAQAELAEARAQLVRAAGVVAAAESIVDAWARGDAHDGNQLVAAMDEFRSSGGDSQ